jgi:glyoxylase-like metal-dependent hydrolase (beta-lactamase superfamily II)
MVSENTTQASDHVLGDYGLSQYRYRCRKPTTHFHPEHAAGEPGFPASTILIRNTLQQQEMEKHGQEMIDMFSKNSPNKELLAGVVLRQRDAMFDQEARIDLGGVTARLIWFGEAHTKGDELTFVEPDRALISGDVAQNTPYR